MSSITIPIRTVFTLSWTLLDQQGDPINNATVTATLYTGRSVTNPDSVPGTTVPPIVGVNLAFVANGLYAAPIAATVDPPEIGFGYILVIDGAISGNPIYHAEPVVVVSPAPVDLTTVTSVKSWLNITDSGSDDLIQACITANGMYWLWRTGLGNQNSVITGSPLNSIQTYNETYDGMGTNILILRNRPIQSVVALMINNIVVQQSSNPAVGGWVVDGEGISVRLRGGIGGNRYGGYGWGAWGYRALGAGLVFTRGVQNVQIQYTAGFQTVPYDVELASKQIVAQNLKRRDWIDEKSRVMQAGAGTQVFRDWVIPPEADATIRAYSRTL